MDLGADPFLPSALVSGGDLRSPGPRSIAQIAVFLLEVAPVVVVPFIVRQWSVIGQMAGVLIRSNVILATIGWLQLAVWNATGRNLLPIGGIGNWLGGAESVRGAVETVNGTAVLRMSSFGGEPKGLGQNLVLALLLVQCRFLVRGSQLSRRSLSIWAFLMLSSLATLSASAVYLWLIGTVVQLSLLFFRAMSRRGGSSIKQLRSMAGVLLLVVGILFGGLAVIGQQGDVLKASFNRRVIERDPIEDFDAAIGDFLLAEPFRIPMGVGLGNAHLYADSYLPPEARRYAAGTAFVAKSGYLRLISELGLVGLVLFVIWVGRVLWRVQKVSACYEMHSAPGFMGRVAWQFGWVVFWAFLARGGYISPIFFLVMGSCAAIVALHADAVRPRQNPRYQT